MLIKKITLGKLGDIAIIACMLSFTLGIALANLGEFPYTEQVEIHNLVASLLYLLFWVLFVSLTHVFNRRRLLIFEAMFITASFLFSIWYVCVAITPAALPAGLVNLFSSLTFCFHSHFIGYYYFIRPVTPLNYSILVFITLFLLLLLMIVLVLKRGGYFEKLRACFTKHTPSLSRKERMKLEIEQSRRERAKKKKTIREETAKEQNDEQ